MAVFPKRPDLHDEQSEKEYIMYMVERLEYTIDQLRKEIAELRRNLKG